MSTDKTPLLISYPRCGQRWINSVLSFYFDAPRGPNVSGEIPHRKRHDDEPFKWIHVHDTKLRKEVPTNGTLVMFLYRDPVDAIYSLSKTKKIDIKNEAEQYKNLMEKWVDKSSLVVTYEDFQANPIESLRKFNDVFSFTWDPKRAQEAIDLFPKKRVMNNEGRFHRSNVLDKNYGASREEFRKQNAKQIYDITTTEATFKYLERYVSETGE